MYSIICVNDNGLGWCYKSPEDACIIFIYLYFYLYSDFNQSYLVIIAPSPVNQCCVSLALLTIADTHVK